MLAAVLNNSNYVIALGAVSLCLYLVFRQSRQPKGIEAPYAIPYQRYLPRWISGLIYATNAMEMIEEGHRKYPNTPFKLVRTDTVVTFLPVDTLDELSSLNHNVASNIGALTHDLVAHWSGLNLPTGSTLHYRVVQRKMVSPPSLESILPSLEDEIRRAVQEFFPQEDQGWVALRPFDLFQHISARLSSRTLIGEPLCRDSKWNAFTYKYTEDLFSSIITLRLFPPWTWPILNRFLPSYWRTKEKVRQAETLLGPYFEEALKLSEAQDLEKTMEEPNGFKWCTQMARGIERDGVKIAQCQAVLALGAIHTTFVSNINILYDLIENPDYIEILRNEISELNASGWSSASYSKLDKLDSVLRESLRMNPPTMIGIRRVMQKDYTLKNGLYLPKGSYVSIPTYTVQNDPSRTSHAEAFDGLRSYKQRMEAGEESKHTYVDTEASALGFGHAKTACPGRWFASISMKALFVKLLSEFEFEFGEERTKRPENIILHEINLPDPYKTVLVKRRAGYEAPF